MEGITKHNAALTMVCLWNAALMAMFTAEEQNFSSIITSVTNLTPE